ncbi:MAG: AAA family ATPase [Lachnospiraceae bacterium]|nr:AAA family ATPase [Lachnospiraceae bacterium]
MEARNIRCESYDYDHYRIIFKELYSEFHSALTYLCLKKREMGIEIQFLLCFRDEYKDIVRSFVGHLMSWSEWNCDEAKEEFSFMDFDDIDDEKAYIKIPTLLRYLYLAKSEIGYRGKKISYKFIEALDELGKKAIRFNGTNSIAFAKREYKKLIDQYRALHKEYWINDTSDDKKTVETRETLDGLLEEINSLIGLRSVKSEISSLVNTIKVRKLREERGINNTPLSLHLVFTGNPGTGKTTVARLVARLYHELGVLSKGQLVEVDRSDLVAGYVGQTAIKTSDKIKDAMGGVLFIDEAYSLAKSSDIDFGHEAIETLLKAMEDNRNDLIIIVAGYDDLMEKFINSNPGLKSRFNKYIHFEDYGPEELMDIFKHFCDKHSYIVDPSAESGLELKFSQIYKNRGKNFANGRDVRNIFEKALQKQANRIAMMDEETLTDEDLKTIKYEDVIDFIDSMIILYNPA